MSIEALEMTRAVAEAPARRTYSVDWLNASGILSYHLVALLAFSPWFFSWTGVILLFAGIYAFGTLGINLCYHRLLTHRGFVCPKWLEHALAVLAVCAFQDTPARWVAVHRSHHEHADDEPDPHTPLVSFLWAHIGWIVMKSADMERLQIYARYAKDIVRDPFYRRLDHPAVYLGIILTSWTLFFAAGFFGMLAAGGTLAIALQFGFSLLVWGVFLRTVVVWHITWSVNSITHMWGYKTYETGEESRNNVLIGLLSNGEGWHNNHHADPRSARHGHQWWEFDVTWLSLRLLGWLGLAHKIATPALESLSARKVP
jgi:stearoyl-CoA desaturase (delta-9 desaturase)